MELHELKARVCEEIDRHCEEVMAFGTDIWNHPEPGYREVRTAEKAAERLEKLGLKVKRAGTTVTSPRWSGRRSAFPPPGFRTPVPDGLRWSAFRRRRRWSRIL